MKYLKLFENYESYFAINQNEYNLLITTNQRIFSFSQKDMKILSDFLKKEELYLKFEFIVATVTSCYNTFLLEDSYGLCSDISSREITIVNSGELSYTFESNPNDDISDICTIDNYSLVITSLRGDKRQLFINKCDDEWFSVDAGQIQYKCDQLTGLVDLLTNEIPKFFRYNYYNNK